MTEKDSYVIVRAGSAGVFAGATAPTPTPLPAAPPSANEANERQNQCIWPLQAAHTATYEEIVNGCGAVQEATP